MNGRNILLGKIEVNMADKLIKVPYDLGRLLLAEPEDYIDRKKYKEMLQFARTLLRLLMESQK